MKRVHEEVREYPKLPREVVSLIIIPLYGISSGIVLVCKEWYEIIEGYKGWFERAKELYMSVETFTFSKQKNWFRQLSELDEEERKEYKVYGGVGRNDSETIMSKSIIDFSPLRSIPLGKERKYHEIQKALYYLEEKMPQDESERIKNYLGKLFVAKYKRLMDCQITTYIPGLYTVLVFIREETSSVLVRRNFHPRDIHISFTEVGHQYTLRFWSQEESRFLTIKSIKFSEGGDDDNDSLNLPSGSSPMRKNLKDLYYQLYSGTGFIGTLFPPFDPCEAARNRHDRTVPDEVIIEQWKQLGIDASTEGTKMHQNNENDALDRPWEKTSPESLLYQEYKGKIVNGKMRPYRAEWKVWDPVHSICGSIDILYEEWPPRHCPGRDPKKKYLFLGDYKRSKEIKLMNPYQSGIPECKALAHAGDCNFIHYMIQLNLYKYILETYYDIVILQTFIIVLHPNQAHFIKMNLNPPPGFIESILQYRRDTLALARAKHVREQNEQRGETEKKREMDESIKNGL